MAAVSIIMETALLPGSVVYALAGFMLSKAFNDTAQALFVGTTALFIASVLSAITAFAVGRHVIKFDKP